MRPVPWCFPLTIRRGIGIVLFFVFRVTPSNENVLITLSAYMEVSSMHGLPTKRNCKCIPGLDDGYAYNGSEYDEDSDEDEDDGNGREVW